MRSFIPLAFIAVLSSAISAFAQTAAEAQEPWRLGGSRSVTPTGPGRLKEIRGVLVSDPGAREIRLESEGRQVVRVPYDVVVAIHYERAEYPRRFLRRPSFYLVVHYTDAAGVAASETIRILSERDALAAIGGGLGALVSTTIGAMRYPFNDAFDVFRAGPARASRSPTITIVPTLGHSRALTVSVTF